MRAACVALASALLLGLGLCAGPSSARQAGPPAAFSRPWWRQACLLLLRTPLAAAECSVAGPCAGPAPRPPSPGCEILG